MADVLFADVLFADGLRNPATRVKWFEVMGVIGIPKAVRTRQMPHGRRQGY